MKLQGLRKMIKTNSSFACEPAIRFLTHAEVFLYCMKTSRVMKGTIHKIKKQAKVRLKLAV